MLLVGIYIVLALICQQVIWLSLTLYIVTFFNIRVAGIQAGIGYKVYRGRLVTIGIIPYGTSVKLATDKELINFDPKSSLQEQHRIIRTLLPFFPMISIFGLACLGFGFFPVWHEFLISFEQIIKGGLLPFSQGKHFIQTTQITAQHSSLLYFIVMAQIKLIAFNLPFDMAFSLSQLVSDNSPIKKWINRLQITLVLVAFYLVAAWVLAFIVSVFA